MKATGQRIQQAVLSCVVTCLACVAGAKKGGFAGIRISKRETQARNGTERASRFEFSSIPSHFAACHTGYNLLCSAKGCSHCLGVLIESKSVTMKRVQSHA